MRIAVLVLVLVVVLPQVLQDSAIPCLDECHVLYFLRKDGKNVFCEVLGQDVGDNAVCCMP